MGKQEKYKKEEDGRDIFDVALDVVTLTLPIAGAVAGHRVGKRIAKTVPTKKSATAYKLLGTSTGLGMGASASETIRHARKKR